MADGDDEMLEELIAVVRGRPLTLDLDVHVELERPHRIAPIMFILPDRPGPLKRPLCHVRIVFGPEVFSVGHERSATNPVRSCQQKLFAWRFPVLY